MEKTFDLGVLFSIVFIVEWLLVSTQKALFISPLESNPPFKTIHKAAFGIPYSRWIQKITLIKRSETLCDSSVRATKLRPLYSVCAYTSHKSHKKRDCGRMYFVRVLCVGVRVSCVVTVARNTHTARIIWNRWIAFGLVLRIRHRTRPAVQNFPFISNLIPVEFQFYLPISVCITNQVSYYFNRKPISHFTQNIHFQLSPF